MLRTHERLAVAWTFLIAATILWFLMIGVSIVFTLTMLGIGFVTALVDREPAPQ